MKQKIKKSEYLIFSSLDLAGQAFEKVQKNWIKDLFNWFVFFMVSFKISVFFKFLLKCLVLRFGAARSP